MAAGAAAQLSLLISASMPATAISWRGIQPSSAAPASAGSRLGMQNLVHRMRTPDATRADDTVDRNLTVDTGCCGAHLVRPVE